MNNSINISNDLEVAESIIKEKDFFYYNQSFYVYDTNYWKLVSINFIKKIILDTLHDQYKQNRVNNIIDILKIKTQKLKNEINLNNKDVAINIKNGHYYLKKNKLLPHSEKTKKTYSINIFNVTFKENSKCDRWVRFVNEIFEPDSDRKDKIKFLQEYLGYCLTQNVLFQKSLLMLGTGANGKSKIIEIMQRILGHDNYSNIELHQFSKPAYVIELQNKLVNFCSEIDYKNKFSSGVFKRIVTGETLTGDAKFKDPVKFEPYCKLIFASNDFPLTNDTTKGYFRRLVILKFNRNFEGKERDDNLLNDLCSELDGIFNWILKGLKRLYYQKGFTIPKSHEIELQDYLESSNSVVSFINERYEKTNDINDWVSYEILFSEYENHAKEEGSYRFTKKRFKNEVLKQFPDIKLRRWGDRGNHFQNIKLRDDSGSNENSVKAEKDELPF